jgi:tagaturonate reductase
MQLNKKILPVISSQKNLQIPAEKIFLFPEKVLQFGTGVLLRGLPDYFIDKANKKNIFKGRIVVVKSTNRGSTDEFEKQEGLYTLCIRGIQSNRPVNDNILNAAISRALSAQSQWKEILSCAANPEMELIISNTTEVGITLMKEDDIKGKPPASFPGKLLAFLYERFKIFKGDPEKGMVIVPTELIIDNGKKLADIVTSLAKINKLEMEFIEWLTQRNYFCDSLVDRIVPGRLPVHEQKITEEKIGYKDPLMIMAEPYHLWAIETAAPKVQEVLSFAKTDKNVIIAPDIETHRELKLRLLNGTHTFSCGLAFLSGFQTVKEAMDNRYMGNYIQSLMLMEIAPAITSDRLSIHDTKSFSKKVLDRFRNPFIEHQWISITLQYSSKMKMRNIPVLIKHYEKSDAVPENMALGFAAYLLFMKCEKKKDGEYYGYNYGKSYVLQDDHAGYFAEQWKETSPSKMVRNILRDKAFWGSNVDELKGFADTVTQYLIALIKEDRRTVIKKLQAKKIIY